MGFLGMRAEQVYDLWRGFFYIKVRGKGGGMPGLGE